MALDFTSFSDALAADVGPTQPEPSSQQADRSLVLELQGKFKNNQQAETQQMLAVLGACGAVLASAGLPDSPTALFAASMSSLEKPEIQASPEVGSPLATPHLLVMLAAHEAPYLERHAAC